MKKTIYTVLIFLVLIFSVSFSAKAVDVNEYQAEALEVEKVERALPAEAEEVLSDVNITDISETDTFFEKLFEIFRKNSGGILKNSLKSASSVLAISLFSAIAGSFCNFSVGKNIDVVGIVGVLAVVAATSGSVSSFISMGREVMNDLNGFSTILLPTLTAASAAAGAITASGAKYAATMLFIDILITLANKLVMPLIYVYISVSAAGAAIGGKELDGISELIKKLIKFSLTVIMLAFTVYLTVTGVISDTADAAASKVAKTVISSSLPVVGSIISDASSTILSGVSMLRNSVGIFGLFAVSAVCILPVVKLGVNYLVFKMTAACSAVVADTRISKAIDAVSNSFGMIMGIVGANAIMLFISVLSLIKAVA